MWILLRINGFITFEVDDIKADISLVIVLKELKEEGLLPK